MSYARFSEGDVYVFASSEGIECCGCWLVKRHWEDRPDHPLGSVLVADTPGERDLVTRDSSVMVAHLLRHRAAGHEVPQDAIDRLSDPEDAAQLASMWAELDAERAR